MTRAIQCCGLAVIFALCAATEAPAAIIYDNLKATTYIAVGGFGIDGPSSPVGGPSFHGESFVASLSGELTDVLLPMWNAGASSAFNLSLTDSHSTVLESWASLAAPSAGSGMIPVVDAVSISHPLLQSGQTYNLVVTPNATTFDAWDESNSLASGHSGFRVEAAAAPEPASATLIGLGAAGLAVAVFRRRRQR